MTVWPPGAGNPNHAAACPRQRWQVDESYMPVVGTRVTCLSSAGSRAGQVFECKKVSKKGWELVVVAPPLVAQ